METIKMPGGLEMTTFKLEKGKTYTDFVAANADVDAWLGVQPGFRSRHVVQTSDGTIIDTLFWDTQEIGTNAMHRLMTELADSPVHGVIDQTTVSWNMYQIHHQVSVSERSF